MLSFDTNAEVAEQQLQAIIFCVTTFGYIDGDFDLSEKEFIRDYVRTLVQRRVDTALADATPELQAEHLDRWTTHFLEVFEGIDREIGDLFTEAVSHEEDHGAFVYSQLKVRCFEIFEAFDVESQSALLDTVDELVMADGVAHPAEVQFRGELAELLEADLGIELVEEEEEEEERPPVDVEEPEMKLGPRVAHPFFQPFEAHYALDRNHLATQVTSDIQLLDRVKRILDEKRAAGAGRLTGKQTVGDLRGIESFLDGHVHVLSPTPGKVYELTVLGDLHGCYSCLKGAVMQSRFLEKVELYREDPARHPDPKLVLLGDYIDRGRFSYNGVLRAVLELFCAAPDHVYVLRGNHEYYIEVKGDIFGGVKPAEAINSLKPHVPQAVLRRFMHFFDDMPSSLLFDRTLFVHGGIPRDGLIKERWQDLSTLNDPEVRFQMMWSDPSSAEVIPAKLQDASARFAFGRAQCQAFLRRIGCHTLIRGHEKIQEGFRRIYDDSKILLITLFSAGGRDNDDLPANSGYRLVDPMALTLTHRAGRHHIQPWSIDYAGYNDPKFNAFFRSPPELE
jgi:hypothetical protein